jgi:hypothetical protein
MKENSMSDDEKLDLSCLDPSVDGASWNARIEDIVAQSRLLRSAEGRGESLSQLDTLRASDAFEGRLAAIVGQAYREPPQPWYLGFERQVLAAGPRALLGGAVLAAATWLGALLGGGPAPGANASLYSPGLSLAMWAEQGRVPETREILLVIEVTSDEQ